MNAQSAFSAIASTDTVLVVTAGLLSVVSIGAQQSTPPVPPQRLPNTVSAQQPGNPHPEGWLNRPTVTGDWDGQRTKLENIGVLLRALF